MTCPSTNISFWGYPIRLPLSLLLIPMYPIHLPILMGFTLPKLPKRPGRNSLRGQFPNHMASARWLPWIEHTVSVRGYGGSWPCHRSQKDDKRSLRIPPCSWPGWKDLACHLQKQLWTKCWGGGKSNQRWVQPSSWYRWRALCRWKTIHLRVPRCSMAPWTQLRHAKPGSTPRWGCPGPRGLRI